MQYRANIISINIILDYNIIMSGIILAFPIGAIYSLLINKLAEIVTKNDEMKDKVQKSFVIEIFFGLLALVIGYIVFGKGACENRIVKYGIWFGGVILLFYTMVINWEIIQDVTKFGLFCTGFVFLIGIAYQYRKSSNDKQQENRKSSNDKQQANRKAKSAKRKKMHVRDDIANTDTDDTLDNNIANNYDNNHDNNHDNYNNDDDNDITNNYANNYANNYVRDYFT